MALLSADDIRFRKFTSVRFREGYDPDEVDDFLEEVISTVEELTRIAQSAATNTGAFQAIAQGPSQIDINNNPIVLGLRAENENLKVRVAQQEEQLAQNGGAAANNGVDSEQLLRDNQEMASRLKAADDEIGRLRSEVEKARADAANNMSNASDSAVAQSDGNPAQAVEEIQRLTRELDNLNSEYNRIKAENNDLDQRIRALSVASGSDAGQAEALRIELQQVRQQLDESNSHVARLQVKLQGAQAGTDTGSLSAIGQAATAVGSGPGQAAAMLNMAQQLHDEYVQKGKNEAARLVEEGKTEKEQLINSAQSEHDRLIKEAQEENAKIISDAKKSAEDTYETLAKERSAIEKKIEELRLFEKDYRQRLKKFLENLLDDVEANGEVGSKMEAKKS